MSWWIVLFIVTCFILQASGYGGTTRQVGHGDDKVELLKPNKERRIKVRFQADTAATMQWNFRPQQTEVTLYAGETALAFYTVGFLLY